MKFCIDTSGWLDGWVRDYPHDVFPSVWKTIDEQIELGNIISAEEVYVELNKKDDAIHDWIKDRKKMLIATDEKVQNIVIELLGQYPRLVDTHKNRSQADPFVIATAECYEAIVVTGETARGKLDKPKIPDVCQVRNISCISFLEMLRQIGKAF